MKLHLGFDAKRLFLNRTGLGNYSRTLVRNLAIYAPESEIQLYTPRIGDLPQSTGFINHQVHTAKGPASWWRSWGIAKQLKADGVLLYHGLSNELPFNIRQAGVKSVVTIHDLIFRIFPETYPLTDRLLYDLKFRKACSNADHIIAISENTKRDLIAHYGLSPDKITVVYQACEDLFYHTPDPVLSGELLRPYQLPAQYWLYVGSVEQRKNLELLLKALQATSVDQRLPVVVVGKGKAYQQQLQQWVNQQQLEPWVIWLPGIQDNKVLQALYQHAVALIYPSRYEGFGLPVAEALLTGTPVITAATSALREAGGPGSVYVDPDNEHSLQQEMQALQQDTVRRQQMSIVGKEYAHAHFDPEVLTAQLVKLYQKVLG